MSERLSEQELREIERYLESPEGERPGPQVGDWLRRLLTEVRQGREGDTGREVPEGGTRKRHGDALLEGEGTRHGEEPSR